MTIATIITHCDPDMHDCICFQLPSNQEANNFHAMMEETFPTQEWTRSSQHEYTVIYVPEDAQIYE